MDTPPPAPSPVFPPSDARTPLAHPALYGIIAALSLIIIAGAVWVFWPRSATSPELSASASPTASPTVSATPLIVDSNWKEFVNARYGFSFRYPPTWCTLSNEERGAVELFFDCPPPDREPAEQDFGHQGASLYFADTPVTEPVTDEGDGYIRTRTPLSINGVSAFEYTYTCPDGPCPVWPTYEIPVPGGKLILLGNPPLIAPILASFRLVR